MTRLIELSGSWGVPAESFSLFAAFLRTHAFFEKIFSLIFKPMSFESLLVSYHISIISFLWILRERLDTTVVSMIHIIMLWWSGCKLRSMGLWKILSFQWVLHEWVIYTNIVCLLLGLLLSLNHILYIRRLLMWCFISERISSSWGKLASFFDIHREYAVILYSKRSGISDILTNLLLMLVKLMPIALVRYSYYWITWSCFWIASGELGSVLKLEAEVIWSPTVVMYYWPTESSVLILHCKVPSFSRDARI